MFEDQLRGTTLHLKDDFSHSSYSSGTSATSFSEFLSYVRIENSIKDTSTILGKEIDQILHFYSKDLDKISATVFETELNDNKNETSHDFTSSCVGLGYLKEC